MSPVRSRRQPVLAAGFALALFSAPGQTFFVALYAPDIGRALALDPIAMAGVYGLATLAGAGLMPAAGWWADRWHPARFAVLVVGGLGLSLVGLALAAGPVSLAIAWTLARWLGQGAAGVGLITSISRTFPTSRGRAPSIGALGHPAGEFAFPLVIAALLAMMSWRTSLLAFAGVYLFLATPALRLGLRSVPATRGERPPSGDPDQSRGIRTPIGAPLAGRTFWLAAAVLTAAPVVVTGLLFHQVAVFGALGLTRDHVPAALMWFATARITATALTGRWIDMGGLRTALIVSCGALVGAMMVLYLPAPDFVRVLGYGGGLGAAVGIAGVAGAAFWPTHFGIELVGRLGGLSSGIRNGATAAAPVVVAVLAERAGPQHMTLVLAAVALPALAAALALPSSRRVRRSLVA